MVRKSPSLAIVSAHPSALSSQHYASAFAQSDSTYQQILPWQSTVQLHQPPHCSYSLHQLKLHHTSAVLRKQPSASSSRTLGSRNGPVTPFASPQLISSTVPKCLTLTFRHAYAGKVLLSSTTCAIPSTPHNYIPMPWHSPQHTCQLSTQMMASNIATQLTSNNSPTLQSPQPNTNHLT